jgi:hypothetical protein
VSDAFEGVPLVQVRTEINNTCIIIEAVMIETSNITHYTCSLPP